MLLNISPLWAITGQEVVAACKHRKLPLTGRTELILQVYKQNSLTEYSATMHAKRDPNFKGGKLLAELTKPSRLKLLIHLKPEGTTDQWVRLSSGKVKRIVGLDHAASFLHSDFSIEDFKPGQNLLLWDREYFTFENLGLIEVRGDQCYKIEARPKEIKQRYDYFQVYIRVKDCLVIRGDAYKDQKLIKSWDNYDIRMVDGYPTPFKMVVTVAGSADRSEIHLKSIQYDLPLADAMFSREYLR
jgi:hypothetical protein